MRERRIIQLVQKLNFDHHDTLIFFNSNLNRQRLISEKYYDRYQKEWMQDKRRSKNFKVALELYSEIMDKIDLEHERISNET
jgi:bisphosphoglycerate-independent phosphoglycerate mutase (AlkP superfamily)